MTLSLFICYTGYLIMSITLIVSFLFCYRKQNPSYLRFFPFYHLFACCIEVIAGQDFIADDSLPRVHYSPYNLFTVVEFIFFFFFILTQLTRRQYKLILCVAGSITLATLLSFLIYQAFNFSIWQGTMTTNIFFILGCLLYFLNTFKKSAYSDLLKEPSFWIMTGLFFYSVIEAPTLAIVLNYKFSHAARLLYTIINGIAYTLLHLLFIKAYTCKFGNNSNSYINDKGLS